MKNAIDISEFTYQNIPMHEAMKLVLAESGNYGEIIAHLIDTIPNLPPDEAHVFGNKKEIPEEARRGQLIGVDMRASDEEKKEPPSKNRHDCYLCEKPIEKEEEAMFYGGPFPVHQKCVEDLIEKA